MEKTAQETSPMTISQHLLAFLQQSTAPGNQNQEENNFQTTEMKARVISTNPLQISDDNINYMDCLNLEKKILQRNIEVTEDSQILLKKWRIAFKKVPGNDDFYFDLEVEDFEVSDEEEGAMQGGTLKNVLDDREIRYFFEVKKRNLLAQYYGIGRKEKQVLKTVDENNMFDMKMEIEGGKNSASVRLIFLSAKSYMLKKFVLEFFFQIFRFWIF